MKIYQQNHLRKRLELRICLLTRSIPIHVPGGFEKYIFDLAFGLTAKGHEVHVITKHLPRKRAKDEVSMLNGVHIHYVGPRSSLFWYSFSFFIEMGKKLAQLQHESPFDIIHSNNLAGFSLYLVRPKGDWPPLVSTAHGTTISEFRTHPKTLFQKIRRSVRFLPVIPPEYVTFLRSKKIICINSRVKKLVEEMNPKFGKKCRIILNGVDTSLFYPNDSRVNDYKRPLIILYTGTLTHSKGVPRLYQAFKELSRKYPTLRLRLVGGGPLYAELSRQVHSDQLQTRVTLDGYINPSNMAEIYRQADIFVLPTESQEGLSFSILEALASGLAVIASDACHMEQVFTRYHAGLTYKSGDTEMLLGLLERLLENPPLVQKLGEIGRALVLQKYRKETMINKVEQVYHTILQN
ncbi:MAG: Glycosyltransferase, family 1 [Promethearchaeota archaeon CR_4]|nr:MAG: Glycosyltransferase, family 1 [Candidatus Lokiarchaeota archaeon CR_4]